MAAAAMLSRESRQWGNCDDDDGKEEVVEVDDNDETTRRQRRLPLLLLLLPALLLLSGSPRPVPPSPVLPVGWGDAWRRRQRRLG